MWGERGGKQYEMKRYTTEDAGSTTRECSPVGDGVELREKEAERMLREERPWLSVYGGKLSDEPIGGSLTEFLEETVEKYRENVALTQGERKISYGELLDLTEKLAVALYEAGIRKGDRVGLMLPNCPEYVIGCFGAMRVGVAATQVNPIYVGRELEHIFSDSGSETVIVHANMYDKVTINCGSL